MLGAGRAAHLHMKSGMAHASANAGGSCLSPSTHLPPGLLLAAAPTDSLHPPTPKTCFSWPFSVHRWPRTSARCVRSARRRRPRVPRPRSCAQSLRPLRWARLELATEPQLAPRCLLLCPLYLLHCEMQANRQGRLLPSPRNAHPAHIRCAHSVHILALSAGPSSQAMLGVLCCCAAGGAGPRTGAGGDGHQGGGSQRAAAGG